MERLGRFMLVRYFSIISPSCFCAPALALPTWFMTFENSGEAIAWPAKALKPFSISPIIFCQIATGSLLFSAIDALRKSSRVTRAGWSYHVVAAGALASFQLDVQGERGCARSETIRKITQQEPGCFRRKCPSR